MPLFLAKFLASSAAAARSSFLRKTRQYGTSTSSSSSGHYQSTTIMLPLMKLGTLAIRTISKPIAARLKTHASVHPRFRAAIIWMAQVNIYSLQFNHPLFFFSFICFGLSSDSMSYKFPLYFDQVCLSMACHHCTNGGIE